MMEYQGLLSLVGSNDESWCQELEGLALPSSMVSHTE